MAFSDGFLLEYDLAVSVLRVSSPQLIKLQASVQLQLVGVVFIDGDLHVTGNVRLRMRLPAFYTYSDIAGVRDELPQPLQYSR